VALSDPRTLLQCCWLPSGDDDDDDIDFRLFWTSRRVLRRAKLGIFI
jgi:hypothetical protein